MEENCLFCKIVNKEIPASLVYEDEDVVAFKDINPQAPVHLLFIPKKPCGASAPLFYAPFRLWECTLHTPHFCISKITTISMG